MLAETALTEAAQSEAAQSSSLNADTIELQAVQPDGMPPQPAEPDLPQENSALEATPAQESAPIQSSAADQVADPTPAPTPTESSPADPDRSFVPKPGQTPIWVGASDASLKIRPKPKPKPGKASSSSQKPPRAKDPEGEPAPTLVPVPVPLSIPADAPAAAGASTSASGRSGSDDFVESAEVGIGAAGPTSHRADDERPTRLSHVSTGALVGTVAVVAIVVGGVIFTSSPSSHSASTPSPHTGLVITPGPGVTLPQIITDGRSAPGQSAAPNRATATPTPSVSAHPSATSVVGGILPTQGPTPTVSPKVVNTTNPPTANPFTVTASRYTSMNNINTEATTDTGGGEDVGWITNGSWLAYSGINFPAGLKGTIKIRNASTLTGANVGQMQFRLNSPNAQPFATLTVNGTGGWQNWQTSTVNEAPIPSGTFTLYVTFSNGGGDFVNVNWFQFS